jgi:hypothetical protein
MGRSSQSEEYYKAMRCEVQPRVSSSELKWYCSRIQTSGEATREPGDICNLGWFGFRAEVRSKRK